MCLCWLLLLANDSHTEDCTMEFANVHILCKRYTIHDGKPTVSGYRGHVVAQWFEFPAFVRVIGVQFEITIECEGQVCDVCLANIWCSTSQVNAFSVIVMSLHRF